MNLKRKHAVRRAVAAAALLLLLTQTALAGSASYLLTVKDGFLCVRDMRSGQWVHTTAIAVDTFSQRDQLLLECGIFLRDRADVTRAMEDFCS